MDDGGARFEYLRRDAAVGKPRLFAVYGTYREIPDQELSEEPFLGWGMDFGADQGALFWDPDDASTMFSASAEDVLAFHQRLGHAALDWLDEG
jgi:hypothetical protein